MIHAFATPFLVGFAGFFTSAREPDECCIFASAQNASECVELGTVPTTGPTAVRTTETWSRLMLYRRAQDVL